MDLHNGQVGLKNTLENKRIKVHIQGAVQGVGFRPFVYRLATQLKLNGWVKNTTQGIYIDVEGPQTKLEHFLLDLQKEKPLHSVIQSFKYFYLDPLGHDFFRIIQSDEKGDKSAWILPDISACAECLEEIFDPNNRRHLYPFTNCTHCGPRYSIMNNLPYDRSNTTMKIFTMCPDCQSEYNDPSNRRFHAQPNACPKCGPHVELLDNKGNKIADKKTAIDKTIEFLKNGFVLAIKGLGGFHLVVDATNDSAVEKLRSKKGREEKPFALMVPRSSWPERLCYLSPLERQLLFSPEAPIVLLKKKSAKSVKTISDHIAPNNPYLGIMLPYTPLHHIILEQLNYPIVATSGNISDETICIDNAEALNRLANIADVFLVHNRPIARHVDDSITRVISQRPIVLRRARGFAPLPVTVKKSLPQILAVGGHLKNSIALSKDKTIYISQHIGDLDTENSVLTMQKTIKDLEKMFAVTPEYISHDCHPDYGSTKIASTLPEKKIKVQHHFAHILSCMAENEIDPPVLGVSWDGTGYGSDGKIWGGEFLLINNHGFDRIAHLRPFPLPGGEAAIKKPYRTAIGLLYEIFADRVIEHIERGMLKFLPTHEQKTILGMLQKDINCPKTSSIGRLFDAVSSLLNIQHINNYEGQAAMMCEYSVLDNIHSESFFHFDILPPSKNINEYIIDWEPMILQILDDIRQAKESAITATKFHNTLVEIILAIAKICDHQKIILSGGTFQNKYLTEKTILKLEENGYKVYWHQQVPPNDGGICLGQIYASLFQNNKDHPEE